MIITNKFNLPQTFMNITKRPTYTKGGAHLSATELISSPRIVQLRKKYEEQIEIDVTEMVWSIFGTAIHGVLEYGRDDNHLVEERLHSVLDGWSISGAIDLQITDGDGVIVSDYKTTGAWSVMNEKKDWEYQLNIYAWLVEKVKEKKVKKLEVVAIIRDWNRRDAQSREGYPEAPVKVIDIPLWSYEERENFIKERITLHSHALFATETGEDLPFCTPEQMWEKSATWAVRKSGNKRATAVFDSAEEAEEKAKALGKGYEVEHRPGERTRCQSFCSVSEFCTQWKSYNEEK